jgi:hypothetical protein
MDIGRQFVLAGEAWTVRTPAAVRVESAESVKVVVQLELLQVTDKPPDVPWA